MTTPISLPVPPADNTKLAVANSPVFCSGHLDVETLTARKILLKHPKSDASITIQAYEEGAGIWVDQGNGEDLVAIYTSHGHTAIGMYGKDKTCCCSIAFAVDKDGTPLMQLSNPNTKEVIMVTFDELKKLKTG